MVAEKYVGQKSIAARLVSLGVILGAGFVIRIILFWQDKVIAADGIGYINIARSIFQQRDFSASSHFPPVYPMLIGLASYFAPYDEIAGKAVSLIMGGLVVIPLYLLGKRMFSEQVGLIAAILAALSPIFVSLSGLVLSQTTYITLLVTALYLCWTGFTRNSAKAALAAGFAFGAAYLTRPEGIIVFAGVSAVFLFLKPELPSKKDAMRLLLFAWLAFAVVASPYVLLLHKVYGTWQLTGKTSATLADSLGWYLNRPDLKREPGFAGLTYLDVMKLYPDFIWKNILKNLPDVWVALRPYEWLLALVGLVNVLFSADRLRRLLFFLATLLPLGVIITFFFVSPGYFSPYLPVFFLLMAKGLETVARWIQSAFMRLRLRRLGETVPWGGVIGIAMAANAIMPTLLADRSVPYHYEQDGARYDHKLIGLMLRKYLPPKSRVMTKSARISFYGDFDMVDIPQASLPEILKAARDGKARYLIADGTLFFSRPQMGPFLTPLLIPQDKVLATGPFVGMPEAPAGFRLILLFKDPASLGVAVYEFPA
jgi:4-amino-4-deoxy-L-arabinose transferase-like glycosyltransferase